MSVTIKGIIFDKDGTLFDFDATWTVWAGTTILHLAGGDREKAYAIAAALEYDLDAGVFLPGSHVIAGTIAEQAAVLKPFRPGESETEIAALLNALAAEAAQVEVTPLSAFFGGLKVAGYRLGIATNDAESSARRHLSDAGALEMLDFIAGYDSGHGFKPGPGQLLAFARKMSLDASSIAMVGDSTHDLRAARAAGMLAIGVLTGPATRMELAPFADVVLTSIADLPSWLDQQGH